MIGIVSDPVAQMFLETAVIPSGPVRWLGKVDALDPDSKQEVASAHIKLRHGVQQVVGVARDDQRTALQKHLALKPVADKLAEDLLKTQKKLEKRAQQLKDEAFAGMNEQFGPKADWAGVHAEVRSWIREQTKTSDGLSRIKKAAFEDSVVAAAIYHSSTVTLGGLSREAHANLRFELMAHYRPDLWAKMEHSGALTEVVGKFGETIKNVEHSFYSEMVVKHGTSKRFEVALP